MESIKEGDPSLPVAGTEVIAWAGHDAISLRMAYLSSPLDQQTALTPIYVLSVSKARALVQQIAAALALLSQEGSKTPPGQRH